MKMALIEESVAAAGGITDGRKAIGVAAMKISIGSSYQRQRRKRQQAANQPSSEK